MSLNQLTTNFLEALQNQQHCLHSLLPPTKPPNHDLRPKGHIIRSLITPQNYINGLSFPIVCSSTTDFSCIVIFCPSIMYIVLCQSYAISKVHACTFVTCSLNVIDLSFELTLRTDRYWENLRYCRFTENRPIGLRESYSIAKMTARCALYIGYSTQILFTTLRGFERI